MFSNSLENRLEEINPSDESCHHILIPTLQYSEINQIYAALYFTIST